MMIGTSVTVDITDDVAGKVEQGVRRGMRTAADVGFAVSQEEAPADRGAGGGLIGSGVQPEWVDDTLVWGYSADHARPVEDGSEPHWPPIEPLKGWARRVLGDESAAWAVQRKIAQEGTPAQPYVGPGIEAMTAELRSQGLATYVEEEFE